MPAEDGYRLVSELRAQNAESGARVPVLALTAYATAEEQRRILASGFDDYLAKPIEAERLAAAVARLVRRPEPA